MPENQSISKPESAEQPPDEGLSSSVLFAVGDRVTATVMIDGHDADDWPYVIYCKKGDELEIRECRPNGWYVVAHPHLEPGAGFMARHRELSPANVQGMAEGAAAQPLKSD